MDREMENMEYFMDVQNTLIVKGQERQIQKKRKITNNQSREKVSNKGI